MEQMIRCPVCDHFLSRHFASGCQGVRLKKCRCKFTAEIVLDKATMLARTAWTKVEHVPGPHRTPADPPSESKSMGLATATIANKPERFPSDLDAGARWLNMRDLCRVFRGDIHGTKSAGTPLQGLLLQRRYAQLVR